MGQLNRMGKFVARPTATAFIIALLLAIWVLSGQLGNRGTAQGIADADTAPSASQSQRANPVKARVRAMRSNAQTYVRQVVVRGRTEANRRVEIRAQTDGQVAATPVEKGQRVGAGAELCVLEPDDREADFAQTKALVRQRELEFRAAVELARKGHRSETQAAAAEAQLDAAKALAERSRVALENIRMRAPFAARVEDRPAEIGDYLQKGDVCAVLLDEDLFLVAGEVSEREVGSLNLGQVGRMRLVGNEVRQGKLRYISKSATDVTRGFRIELEVENPGYQLREGLSADVLLPVSSADAHLVSSALLVLADDGRVGMRGIEAGKVVFYPVEVIGGGAEGSWVTGLPTQATIITVGQEFVKSGQEVDVVLEMDLAQS